MGGTIVKELIFSSANFGFFKVTATEQSVYDEADVKVERYKVEKSDLADKHVVDIVLLSNSTKRIPDCIKQVYHKVFVNHGYNTDATSFSDTQTLIDLLTEALALAKKIVAYLIMEEVYTGR